MTDTRRVCDLSAGELLEAALDTLAVLGYPDGAQTFVLHADVARSGSVVRKLEPGMVRPLGATLGRRALHGLRPPEAA